MALEEHKLKQNPMVRRSGRRKGQSVACEDCICIVKIHKVIYSQKYCQFNKKPFKNRNNFGIKLE
jgi:hypothetical protein